MTAVCGRDAGKERAAGWCPVDGEVSARRMAAIARLLGLMSNPGRNLPRSSAKGVGGQARITPACVIIWGESGSAQPHGWGSTGDAGDNPGGVQGGGGGGGGKKSDG